MDRVLALAAPRPSALQKVLALAASDAKDGGKDYANTKATTYADPGCRSIKPSPPSASTRANSPRRWSRPMRSDPRSASSPSARCWR